jgi:hypothetical protein
LVNEAVAIHGADRVTWSSSGIIKPEQAYAEGQPFYVTVRDGGIKAWADDSQKRGLDYASTCYGSNDTRWTREMLESRGFREKYMT